MFEWKVLYTRSDLLSNVDHYEKTATMFMVLRASSCGWGACFDLVYEPGGYWTCRWGTERCTNHGRLLRTSNYSWKNLRRYLLEDVLRMAQNSAYGALKEVGRGWLESRADRAA